jgi:hypothetical protein
LLLSEENNRQQHTREVTVDGVLLSEKEKQKYASLRPDFSLSCTLIREFGLFKSTFHKNLGVSKPKNDQVQRYESDKCFKS